MFNKHTKTTLKSIKVVINDMSELLVFTSISSSTSDIVNSDVLSSVTNRGTTSEVSSLINELVSDDSVDLPVVNFEDNNKHISSIVL